MNTFQILVLNINETLPIAYYQLPIPNESLPKCAARINHRRLQPMFWSITPFQGFLLLLQNGLIPFRNTDLISIPDNFTIIRLSNNYDFYLYHCTYVQHI
jgi:hypothetical protein